MNTTAARTPILAPASVVAAVWLAASPAFAADAPVAVAAAPSAAVTVATTSVAAPAAPAPASPSVTAKAAVPPKLTYSDAKCTKFTLSGTPPNQKLVCG